ncbi:MAG: adenylyl-sulfate kinase [Sarcina sp.]
MKNLYRENTLVNRKSREKIIKQKGKVIWFTGVSGSGKSTLAKNIERILSNDGKLTYLLDGDNVRLTLNQDLGFSDRDRAENLRRVKEVSNILLNTGVITLASFVSPIRSVREKIKDSFKDDFIEVYVKCSLEECEKRDVKGLYKKVREENIKGFTGIDSNYEEPLSPNLIVDTSKETLEESIENVYRYLMEVL